MSATLRISHDTLATIDDDGQWHCDRKEIERALEALSRDYPPQHYLPDPWENRRNAIIQILGATLVSISPPNDDDDEDPDDLPLIH